jgi:hypothetical protein
MTLNESISGKIGRRRAELGLLDVDVAQRSKMTVYEYGDIESHSDELVSVPPLYHVKKLLNVLQLDLLDTIGLECTFCKLPELRLKYAGKPRSLIVLEQREAKRFDRKQLGDMIGFYEDEIRLIETYTAHLESWVIENIIKLAESLTIPPQVLLDVECVTCQK